MIGAAAGTFVLIPYAIMTGFSVSARRAVFMYLIRMGSQVSGRVYDMLTSLVLSAAAILMPSPLYLWDSGFLMSFGSVSAIFISDCLMEEWHLKKDEKKKGERFGRKILKAALPGICIQLVTFPILLTSYFEFPLYSILLNLWVIPLMSLVMGAGLLGSVLCIFCPILADLVLLVSEGILEVYEWSCGLTLRFPFSRIITGCPMIWQVTGYYLFLLLCFLCRKKRKKRVLLILACGLALLLGKWKLLDTRMEITMMDVGQGDGIFLRTPQGTTILIDGGSTSKEELARYCMEPFLESRGVSTIDYAFLSHGDQDHYSGILQMMERRKTGIPIKNLILPSQNVWDKSLEQVAKQAEHIGTTVKIIKKGERMRIGKVTLTCLGPGQEYKGEKGNEASMILEVCYGHFSMLFTGDLEGQGEKELLQSFREHTFYSILKVSHHGSKGGTSEAFLEKVNTSFALISAGKKNRYGHPNPETLKRLEEKQIPIICTKDSGAITIRTDGKTMEIKVFTEKQDIC